MACIRPYRKQQNYGFTIDIRNSYCLGDRRFNFINRLYRRTDAAARRQEL